MKLFLYLGLVFFLFSCGETVTKKEYQSPDKTWGDIYLSVQRGNLFEDPKVFADAVPKFEIKVILEKYKKSKTTKGFDLKKFISDNFQIPNYSLKEIKSDLEFEKYIEHSFLALKRDPKDDKGSLIPTRKSYFAGGGRFEEMNYMRSYLALGASQSLKLDTLALNQAINCAQFIQDFGHVPAGNRSYYLSRSNPPVFALMIKKLMKTDAKNLDIFGSQLTREYQYWMSTESKEDAIKQKKAKEGGEKAMDNVVFLKNSNLLNRYFDKESGASVEIQSVANQSQDYFKNFRAASESEWPEMSRWMAKSDTLSTLNILPVDLNALLYFMETTLSAVYKSKGKDEYAKSFETLARNRKEIFDQYFWNEKEEFYFDYDFVTQKQSSKATLAGIFPLLVGLADQKQADKVAQKIEIQFLKSGGLVNDLDGSTFGSGEFQMFTIEALRKYGKQDLADHIKKNWIGINRNYFASFGKIESGYNLSLPTTPQKNSQQQRVDGSLSVLLMLLNE